MKKRFNSKISQSTAKSKKAKKTRFILTVLMCFWTLCSFLGTFAFIGNVSTCNTAYADESVTSGYFQGSNIFIPCTSVYRDSPLKLRTDYTNTVSHNFRITTRTDGKYDLYVQAFTTKQVLPLTFFNELGTHFGTTLVVMPEGDTVVRPDNYVHYYGGYALNTSSYTNFPNYYTIIIPAVENGFDPLTVETVTISNRADRYANPDSNTSGLRIANSIRYTDSNGKDFVVWAYAYTDNINSQWRELLSFQPRTYFLSTSLTKDTMYQAGYNDGLEEGRNIYTDAGYDEGYGVGYREGENYGKNLGRLEATNYSFLSMFGALIDAPVKAITGLFNFNILGINLLGFITGAFTLVVIIFIVRLFLGGK